MQDLGLQRALDEKQALLQTDLENACGAYMQGLQDFLQHPSMDACLPRAVLDQLLIVAADFVALQEVLASVGPSTCRFSQLTRKSTKAQTKFDQLVQAAVGEWLVVIGQDIRADEELPVQKIHLLLLVASILDAATVATRLL